MSERMAKRINKLSKKRLRGDFSLFCEFMNRRDMRTRLRVALLVVFGKVKATDFAKQ